MSSELLRGSRAVPHDAKTAPGRCPAAPGRAPRARSLAQASGAPPGAAPRGTGAALTPVLTAWGPADLPRPRGPSLCRTAPSADARDLL
ncbi:hypothetical protein GCM10009730_30770 [Streptomyces albidochromogenes]